MDEYELFSPTFLDTPEKWGRLNALVLDEHDRDRAIPDPGHARRLFIEAGCPSAVFVFDWVERHRTQPCIRLTSMKVVAKLEEGELLGECSGELEIGFPCVGVSPHLWFLYLAVRIKDLSIVEVVLFECICQALAIMHANREVQDDTCVKN